MCRFAHTGHTHRVPRIGFAHFVCDFAHIHRTHHSICDSCARKRTRTTYAHRRTPSRHTPRIRRVRPISPSGRTKKPLITMDEGLAFSSGADMPEPHQDRPVFDSDDTPTAKGADCVTTLSPGANPLPVSSIARDVTHVDDRTTRRHKKPPRACGKQQDDGAALAGVMNEQDRITHDTHFKGYL